ncbi:FtsK/SpoIIIE domain-containing protein [Saccharopolyspora sp. 6T]|uniref:FtsK/SpoIIIE domain-containing protein n=1 Tax=Saccharopolyspora sp. 6T TaxID=2877238 RepID=UPI0027DF8F86|nr:FtsK/SpoIIIE domain-containing protein [Saccharopolyspora sp. 6T]
MTAVFALCGWLIRHPVVLGVCGGVWWCWSTGGVPGLVVVGVLVLGFGAAWRIVGPESFERRVTTRVRSGVMRAAVYELRWARWARAARLVSHDDQYRPGHVPRLLSVRSGRYWDDVRVRLAAGQRYRDIEMAAEALAMSRRVRRCAVREVRPGVVDLGFMRRDPLIKDVALPVVPQCSGDLVDLTSVHLGTTERGHSWRVPLLGCHVFGAGATGSGKGSWLWGCVRQVAPAIASGRVRLSMIDPKGGMEAEQGTSLYTRYAREEPGDIVDVLTGMVDSMSDRKRDLRGRVRTVEPTVEIPLELLVVDELAAVTKYLNDKKAIQQAERLLGILLSQGRALGYSVWSFAQEPTKEIVPMRALFPYRIALRLDSSSQVNMTLGESAWELGARAETIPRALPGVGYVAEDGVREPSRVRAGYTPDAEIRRVAEVYPAPPAAA